MDEGVSIVLNVDLPSVLKEDISVNPTGKPGQRRSEENHQIN